MSSSDGDHVPFQVQVSGQVANQLKQLVHTATLQGRGDVIRRSLRRINAQLRNDARDFGEPVFHLSTMQLTVRLAEIRPVSVYYAVHDREALVFIREFQLLS